MSEVDQAEFWIKYFMSLPTSEVGKELNEFFNPKEGQSAERHELMLKMCKSKELQKLMFGECGKDHDDL